jgi:hypothetical protein
VAFWSSLVHGALVVGAVVVFRYVDRDALPSSRTMLTWSLGIGLVLVPVLFGLQLRARRRTGAEAPVRFYGGWMLTMACLFGAQLTSGWVGIGLALAGLGAGVATLFAARGLRRLD